MVDLRLFLCARALPGAEAGLRKQKGTPIDAFRRDWRPAFLLRAVNHGKRIGFEAFSQALL